MSNNPPRFAVTLYGTRAVGFTYLLAQDGAGLVATAGTASDYHVGGDGRGPAVRTMAEAVAAALAFVPAGAPVLVHAPGTGRILPRLSRLI